MVEQDAGPAIRVEGLDVHRGDRQVLHGLAFAVPRGQIVGLLGPSGCGKSTLMRTIVGVQTGASGTCEVLGLPAPDPKSQLLTALYHYGRGVAHSMKGPRAIAAPSV